MKLYLDYDENCISSLPKEYKDLDLRLEFVPDRPQRRRYWRTWTAQKESVASVPGQAVTPSNMPEGEEWTAGLEKANGVQSSARDFPPGTRGIVVSRQMEKQTENGQGKEKQTGTQTVSTAHQTAAQTTASTDKGKTAPRTTAQTTASAQTDKGTTALQTTAQPTASAQTGKGTTALQTTAQPTASAQTGKGTTALQTTAQPTVARTVKQSHPAVKLTLPPTLKPEVSQEVPQPVPSFSGAKLEGKMGLNRFR